jgi:hypothetical protein
VHTLCSVHNDPHHYGSIGDNPLGACSVPRSGGFPNSLLNAQARQPTLELPCGECP